MKLFLIFLLSYPGFGFALTETEVIRSVLTHDPLIDQSVLKVEAAEGEIQAYRQLPYNNEYFETYLDGQTPRGGTKLVADHPTDL